MRESHMCSWRSIVPEEKNLVTWELSIEHELFLSWCSSDPGHEEYCQSSTVKLLVIDHMTALYLLPGLFRFDSGIRV